VRRASCALIGALLAACTSTSTPLPTALPTPPATQIGVCALVPNMDALVGKTAVDRPGSFTLNDVDRCIWTYATDPARSVGVSVGALRGHTSAISSLGGGETVAGLGDDARWWAGNHLLSVSRGQRSMQVDLQLEDASVSRELAVAIAQAALQNLP
jgi:hypothetical protein